MNERGISLSKKLGASSSVVYGLGQNQVARFTAKNFQKDEPRFKSDKILQPIATFYVDDFQVEILPEVRVEHKANPSDILQLRYELLKEGIAFWDVKPDNIGYLGDGTPVIIDQGACRLAEKNDWLELYGEYDAVFLKDCISNGNHNWINKQSLLCEDSIIPSPEKISVKALWKDRLFSVLDNFKNLLIRKNHNSAYVEADSKESIFYDVKHGLEKNSSIDVVKLHLMRGQYFQKLQKDMSAAAIEYIDASQAHIKALESGKTSHLSCPDYQLLSTITRYYTTSACHQYDDLVENNSSVISPRDGAALVAKMLNNENSGK